MNLNAYAKDHNVIVAETVRTAQTENMPGRDLVTWMEYLSGVSGEGKFLTSMDVDRRNHKKRTRAVKNVAFLYGHRPVHEDVWYLSPYEFVCYWQVRLARYPASVDENDNDAYHAKLTPKGAGCACRAPEGNA